MAPTTKDEQKLQDAFDRRERSLTVIKKRIDAVTSIIATKSDKKSASDNLTHLNEDFEEYKNAVLEYSQLLPDEEEKNKVKDQYDHLKEEVDKARAILEAYVNKLEDGQDNGSQKGSHVSVSSSTLIGPQQQLLISIIEFIDIELIYVITITIRYV